MALLWSKLVVSMTWPECIFAGGRYASALALPTAMIVNIAVVSLFRIF